MRFSVGFAGVAAASLVIGAVTAAVVGPARADAAQPGTLYVDELSSTCSDSGGGTQGLPFCTLQEAASVAQPGDTIIVSVTSLGAIKENVMFTQSGTPSQPITVTWAGTGARPAFVGNGTGTAVFAFSDVHDVNVSGLQVDYGSSMDGADVVGSQDIGLDGMRFYLGTAPTADVAGVRVDGASSNVIVSRSTLQENNVNGATDGIRVLPGASGVTITTDSMTQVNGGTPISVSGADSVDVTSNTVSGVCGDVAIAGTSSAVIENNAFVLSSTVSCTSGTAAAVSVDAASAPSVSSDYNVFAPLKTGVDYSWAGTSYSDVPTFTGAVGQGTHDTMETSAGIPAGEPSPIDSADCDAPGELATDYNDKPHVDDPLVPNTGVGVCYADRGANEVQDTIPTISSTLTPVLSSIPQGITPVTSSATISSPATSNFGYAVTYTVDFGDGSAPVPATAGTGGLVASHSYTTPGLYTVTVTATDTNGTTKQAGAGQFYALSTQPVQGTLSATPGSLPYEASYTATFGSDVWQVASAMLAFGDGTPAASPNVYSGNNDLGWSGHVFAQPGTYTATLTVTDRAGRVTTATVTITVPPLASYVPDGPVRILDTRHNTGGYKTPVGANQRIALPVTGRNGVPASGVTAVVLNVTAVNPTAGSSYVTVYPDGQSRPVASNLNFAKGQTIAGQVTVPVGADGQIDLYNYNGTVNLVADLAGYYTRAGGSGYTAAGPTRILDTRHNTGYNAPVKANQVVSLQVTGKNGVPAGATAVVLNVTAANPTAGSSYVTVYPDGKARPVASNLNFTAGQTIANLVTVPVGANGKIDLYNYNGTVNLIADLAGYYTTTGGSSFGLAGPVRILDTRHNTGGYNSPVGANKTITLQVTGQNGVPASGVTAVVLNVTAVNPTAGSSYITVYPDGHPLPVASNLNFTKGQTIANQVIVPVGADGTIDLYNYNGTVDLIADLAGYYMN